VADELYRTVTDLLQAVGNGKLASDAWSLNLVDIDDLTATDRPRPQALDWRARVIRPDDLLVLDFRGINLTGRGDRLEKAAGKAATLVVTHQSQSLADEAYLNTAGQDEYKHKDLEGHEGAEPAPLGDVNNYPSPVPIRASGRSRLAFTMPDELDSIAFTLDALLLACRTWPLALDSAARSETGATGGNDDDGIIFGNISADLLDTISHARAALGETLDARHFAALEEAATRIASERIAKLGESPAIRERIQDGAIDDALEAVFPVGVRTDRNESKVQRAAGAIYLKTVTGARIVNEIARLGIDPGRLSQVDPGIYTLLQKPHAPSASRTAIEMPWRLIGSPLPGAGFTHAIDPVTHGGRTELWHILSQGHDPAAAAELKSLSERLDHLWDEERTLKAELRFGDRNHIVARARVEERLERAA